MADFERKSDHIRTIIKSRGLWYPNVNGKTFAVFRVDRKHHLMSLVSMLGKITLSLAVSNKKILL